MSSDEPSRLIESAYERLEAARLLLEEDFYEDSVNR